MTAQVTVYADAGITVDVVAGAPPVDQSAQVTALTAQVAQLTADLAAMTAAHDALAAKITKAEADLA